MILGWQLCFPIGILLARYGRTMFRWFPVHRAVQSVGFLFVFIAFFLAVGNQAMLGKPHFYSTHTKLGISLFILIIVQVLLGFFSHEIRKRMGSRMVGYLHMPLGILLYGEWRLKQLAWVSYRTDLSVSSLPSRRSAVRLDDPRGVQRMAVGPPSRRKLCHLRLGCPLRRSVAWWSLPYPARDPPEPRRKGQQQCPATFRGGAGHEPEVMSQTQLAA